MQTYNEAKNLGSVGRLASLEEDSGNTAPKSRAKPDTGLKDRHHRSRRENQHRIRRRRSRAECRLQHWSQTSGAGSDITHLQIITYSTILYTPLTSKHIWTFLRETNTPKVGRWHKRQPSGTVSAPFLVLTGSYNQL